MKACSYTIKSLGACQWFQVSIQQISASILDGEPLQGEGSEKSQAKDWSQSCLAHPRPAA